MSVFVRGARAKDAEAWLKEMKRMGFRSAVVEAARAVNVRLGGR